ENTHVAREITQNLAAAQQPQPADIPFVSQALRTVGAVSPQPPDLTPLFVKAGMDPQDARQWGSAFQLVGGLVGGGEGETGATGSLRAAIDARTPKALA